MQKALRIITAVVLSISIPVQSVTAFELPNLRELAEEAGSGISGVTESVGGAVSDKAEQSGKAISGAASEAGEIISGAAEAAGGFITGTVYQAGFLASGFAAEAGKVASEWGKQAGKTADGIKKALSDAGVTALGSAAELGNTTAKAAGAVAELSGKAADNAIKAVSGASDLVIDQAGHVIDLAAVGADYVSGAAGQAMIILQEKGTMIMGLAEESVANIDLEDSQNWDEAKTAVEDTIEKAYDEGILGEGVSKDTVTIVTNVVFGSLMYGYQYSNGQITLGVYAASMSEVIIKEGLPSGVGFIVKLLPLKIPHADFFAKEATAYLISKAYGDKSGDEIEAEEEQLMEEELEEATETVMETEAD